MYKSIRYYNDFKYLKNEELNKKSNYIIFVTEDFDFNHENFLSLDIKFYGAIFPKIIYKNNSYNNGFLLIELRENTQVLFFENINETTFIDNQFEFTKSIISIFDGFSTFSCKFLEELFENIKLHTNIVGGGAGLLNKPRGKNIFSNDGIFLDSAFVILLEKKMDLGIGHGWKYLEGPFIATKTKENTIEEIDYENAFDVYKKVVEEDCKKIITKDNFLEISMCYPLGIVKFNGESLIRDPIEIDEYGNMRLAGDIKTNTIFNILKGDKQELITAAVQAAKESSINCNEIFLFECITRLQFLADSFDIEIEQILNSTNIENIYGIFSVGEVGNNGDRYINILNKTSVMSQIWH
jgi:hypothetical protein